MARARRGRPVDGWLVLDKPLGMSSAQAVAKVRWATGAAKAGHAGTLDPLATGVLPVALGEATKTIPHVQDGAKSYRFTVRWGVATSTDDAEGEAVAVSDLRPDEAAIRAALPAFTGDILQTPPQFSAVKVDGQRAYALARGGETVALAARPLHVARLALVDRPDADCATLEMDCGKGGYVRSVARDLGAALGCHGHVVELRRLRSGPFGLERAIAVDLVERLRHGGGIDAHLLPVSTGLDDIPALAVSAEAAADLRMGRSTPASGSDLGEDAVAWAAHHGRPVAIGVIAHGLFHPRRVLNLTEGEPDVDHA
jgi:tRNA pseudouridine55 synthase